MTAYGGHVGTGRLDETERERWGDSVVFVVFFLFLSLLYSFILFSTWLEIAAVAAQLLH